MVVTGYKIGSTDLKDIEMELVQIQKKINKIAKKEYHRMLGEEIAFLCDCICLNILTRKPDENIYDVAVSNLSQRIRTAQQIGAGNQYNMNIFLHLLTDADFTYLKLISPNNIFLSAFKDLENYSLTEIECQDTGNKKTVTWQRLHALYKDREPATINLTPEITPDKKCIQYPDFEKRKEKIARHNLTNHYLNQLAGGAQIPQFLTMRYFDMALEQVMSAEGKREMKRKEQELSQILIHLEKDDAFVFGEKE